MSKTAVIYWSSTGNTEAMALALANSITSAGGEAETFNVSSNTPSSLADYSAVALGCSAMGSEQLDETEFEPYFTSILSELSGKKVFLFGSYGWGDGEWMRTWENTLMENGISVATPSVIANGAPDDSAIAQLDAAAKALL